MIHLICFVKSKKDMGRKEFRNHWANVHGPIVAGIVAERGNTESYVQYPRTDEDYDREGAPDYDGVAVHSFADMDQFRNFVSLPEVAERLGPDGPKFMDQDKSVWIMTEEPLVVVDRSRPRSAGT